MKRYLAIVIGLLLFASFITVKTSYASSYNPLHDRCQLPKAAADEKVVFIDVENGQSPSNVFIGSYDRNTTAIPVYIEPRAEKIYLILSSQQPVIWQLSGDLKSVSRLTLMGKIEELAPGKPYPTDGHLGTAVSPKVSFPVSFTDSTYCGLTRLHAKRRENISEKAKASIGREPEYAEIADRPVLEIRIGTDSLKLNTERGGEQPVTVPEGLDPLVLKRLLRGFNGDLIKFDIKDILSTAPIGYYEVLPNAWGLAQLSYQQALIPVITYESIPGAEKNLITLPSPGGKLVSVKGLEYYPVNNDPRLFRRMNGFKIVKPIPHFPPGLWGGNYTNFILAKGVPMPKGSPGDSFVRCEEPAECPRVETSNEN